MEGALQITSAEMTLVFDVFWAAPPSSQANLFMT